MWTIELWKRKIKVEKMGEKLQMKVAIFPRFCPVLSLTERFVWRFRGFDWRVLSFLSLPSVFLVSFCCWPWRLWRTTPRLHSDGDDSHAAGPPISFATKSSAHRCASGCYMFGRKDFSGRREVFRSIGTHVCVHAHMNGYGGLSISASQK